MTPIPSDKLQTMIKDLQKRVSLDIAGVCYPPKILLSMAMELKQLREEKTFKHGTAQ